jgi:hypothetical protein
MAGRETRREMPAETEDDADQDRRNFLSSCGKFAAVTPPAITILLSTSLNSKAIARSDDGDRRLGSRRRWGTWLDFFVSTFQRH